MEYQKIRPQDINYLISVTSEDRVYYGDQINEDYSHDEMQEYGRFMPEVVVEVMTTEEVSKIMKYAYENNIPVTPRGSGTGLCGGAVAIHGGIMISTLKMNKILEIDEENLMAKVQAGVLLMDFNKAVTEKNLFYPPDPGEKSATIGGNVMTNAGGMRAVKYGVTRDYVRGMTIVLPNGEVIETGGKVIKNSSGYSIKDIMIGSEGTLGIVTEIIVRLLPLPKKAVSLLVPFPSLDKCIETVPFILRSRSIPTAVEFMQREVIEAAEEHLGREFPDKSADAYLLLSFDGNSKEEIEEIYDEVAQLCLERGAIDVLISNTQERHESIWSTRGAFLEAIKGSTPEGLDECDVVVPKNKVADFVKFCAQLEKEFGVRIRQFGHAGDGNLHVYACKDNLPDEEWKPKVAAIMERMYEKAIELEGQVSGEHGIGHAKIGFLDESVGDVSMEIMKGIKKAFDPKNILNPGKVVKY
ncbi:glycolate oxidase [Anaerobranca californiensis DSM 14826]|jgi:glycolate oxidase|uniref:Glycolate oxidase n=1 Tax=Anaerobranca californiensis DSM 14826 TaxID=1120989 RepID=A0A1M6NUQ6_9FIRM|nr:FAD-binding oxidoreductase [Anaerobranca californiensis]SHJ99499.1 glycolate oxidase [Anaerobranca californiensis DSM 14826]